MSVQHTPRHSLWVRAKAWRFTVTYVAVVVTAILLIQVWHSL